MKKGFFDRGSRSSASIDGNSRRSSEQGATPQEPVMAQKPSARNVALASMLDEQDEQAATAAQEGQNGDTASLQAQLQGAACPVCSQYSQHDRGAA